MIGKESTELRDLSIKAQAGDMSAGRRLVERCRRGMVVPYWERPQKITEEVIERHLERRAEKMAGKTI